MKKSSFRKIGLILLLILLFSAFSFKFSKGSGTSFIAFHSIIMPNNTTRTEYSFIRYVALHNMTILNGILKTDNYYWINSTASNNDIKIHNWFDGFGTCLSTSKADNITLYVGTKGAPSKVIGATSQYHAGNQTLDLTISEASYVGVHWNTGGSIILVNPDRKGFFHSCEAETGYKTMYGFGVIQGGYIQYDFTATVYCKNGRNDIETVKLQLGNQVSFTYNDKTHEIIESDPNDYCQIAKEWYPETSPSAWVNYESNKNYLHVGFNVRFLQISGNKTLPHYWFMKYEPYHVQQNATVTVATSGDGTRINNQPGIFFIGASKLAFIQPVPVPWELSFFFIGLGGMFLMCASLFYGGYKIKKGEYAEGIGWGTVLFFISIGLIIVWLWK